MFKKIKEGRGQGKKFISALAQPFWKSFLKVQKFVDGAVVKIDAKKLIIKIDAFIQVLYDKGPSLVFTLCDVFRAIYRPFHYAESVFLQGCCFGPSLKSTIPVLSSTNYSQRHKTIWTHDQTLSRIFFM